MSEPVRYWLRLKPGTLPRPKKTIGLYVYIFLSQKFLLVRKFEFLVTTWNQLYPVQS